MQVLLFLKANWHIIVGILLVLGLAVWMYIDWQYVLFGQNGPRDTVGNGITVGLAKAFDNRSLWLRIERLSNSLAQMKVLDQKAGDNIGKFQAQSSTAQTFTLDVKAGNKPAASGTPQTPPANAPAADGARPAAPPASNAENKSEPKSEVTLAAGDILNDQLNLASQIMNLQTLYERSLTDRLIESKARLQTVLGFQVSISPPAGFENCVAIVEVAVRMMDQQPAEQNVTSDLKCEVDDEDTQGSPGRVSLVAMIPQEKTYNAQSISTNSKSIGGSAVASVVTLGVTSKGETRQLFVHRDSDTVAFERNPTEEPRLFTDKNDAIVFGWEFRPVLGRETVSPGMRQMLAVVAVPRADASQNPNNVVLEIRTRSYWRRYNSRTQTSSRKWHWFPRRTNGAGIVQSEESQKLAIPNTARIEEGLAPQVEQINWVNSGDRATVIVKGTNFFPGTKVIAGGKEHRDEDSTLTLKSDQSLEFETTVKEIAKGDAVLSGRFGQSLQLKLSKEKLPVKGGLYMTRASLKQSRRGKDLKISIDVKGLDGNGDDIALKPEDLEGLPDSILFIGSELVPPPYDIWPLTPQAEKEPDPEEKSTPDGTVTRGSDFSFDRPSTLTSIRVEANIPSHIPVTRSSSVIFRVPFCGMEYQTSRPIQFFPPTVTRLGGSGNHTVFRISHSLWHEKAVSVEVDKTYYRGSNLEKIGRDNGEYRLTLANEVVAQYDYLVLRIAGAEPYELPLPKNLSKPKPVLEINIKPPEIVKGSIGPAVWSGTDLGLITAATLTPAGSQTKTKASVVTYEGGKKIAVYFTESSTSLPGMAIVELQVGTSDSNLQTVETVPVVITNQMQMPSSVI